jgi:phasin family protein
MNADPQQFMMEAWKQQLDAGLRAIEALVEGATRMHEMQLEAATQAHADAIATQKAIAGATSPAEILRLQAQWTQSNAGKCVEYWRSLQEAATQTGAKVAGCLCAPAVIAPTQAPRKADPVRS